MVSSQLWKSYSIRADFSRSLSSHKRFHSTLTCLNVNKAFSGCLTKLGGLSGRRGLSGPISDPLDSESCIRSNAEEESGSCLRLCNLMISSRIFCAILSWMRKSGQRVEPHNQVNKDLLTWGDFAHRCVRKGWLVWFHHKATVAIVWRRSGLVRARRRPRRRISWIPKWITSAPFGRTLVYRLPIQRPFQSCTRHCEVSRPATLSSMKLRYTKRKGRNQVLLLLALYAVRTYTQGTRSFFVRFWLSSEVSCVAKTVQ